jgi:hypothetical protein
MPKKPTYVYGKSPNPRNWHEAADVLKGLSRQKKQEKRNLMDKVVEIERMLKEKK